MSAAPDGPSAAFSKVDKCERVVHMRQTKHVTSPSWRLYPTHGVEITTKLVDAKDTYLTPNALTTSVDNSEGALSSKAEDMAPGVLQNTRNRRMKAQQQQPGAESSSSSSRRIADRDVGCPIQRHYAVRVGRRALGWRRTHKLIQRYLNRVGKWAGAF